MGVLILVVTIILAVPVLFVLICRKILLRPSTPISSARQMPTIGIFHPYCNAGGGGERVLWVAIQALERLCFGEQSLRVVIYTGDDDATPAEILEKAKSRFHVDLSRSRVKVDFVFVQHRHLMAAARWPRFTMLGQSLGTMIITWNALRQFRPDVFLDTTGCAFTYFVAKLLAGVKVATYTHYPTITSDMLQRVYDRRPTYNNSSAVSSSALATLVKVVYYRIFAVVYRWAGSLADVVMVNSNWTKAHLDTLWHIPGGGARVVFPPCNTAEFQELPFEPRDRSVISVGQFRPEKDHTKQLLAFAKLKEKGPEFDDVVLILLGGARDTEDLARVADLEATAVKLGIKDSVKFMLNTPFSVLRQQLGKAAIGIHTMWCEHFGIGVVEMMAAGVATVAHRSGGPLTDIVTPFQGGSTGWLADSPEEYANAMAEILLMQRSNISALVAIKARARASVQRFSDEDFAAGFVAAMKPVLVNQ